MDELFYCAALQYKLTVFCFILLLWGWTKRPLVSNRKDYVMRPLRAGRGLRWTTGRRGQQVILSGSVRCRAQADNHRLYRDRSQLEWDSFISGAKSWHGFNSADNGIGGLRSDRQVIMGLISLAHLHQAAMFGLCHQRQPAACLHTHHHSANALANAQMLPHNFPVPTKVTTRAQSNQLCTCS